MRSPCIRSLHVYRMQAQICGDHPLRLSIANPSGIPQPRLCYYRLSIINSLIFQEFLSQAYLCLARTHLPLLRQTVVYRAGRTVDRSSWLVAELMLILHHKAPLLYLLGGDTSQSPVACSPYVTPHPGRCVTPPLCVSSNVLLKRQTSHRYFADTVPAGGTSPVLL